MLDDLSKSASEAFTPESSQSQLADVTSANDSLENALVAIGEAKRQEIQAKEPDLPKDEVQNRVLTFLAAKVTAIRALFVA